MVALTAVLPDGRRLPFFGRVGTSLASALRTSPHAELSASAPVLGAQRGAEAHVRVAHTHPLAPLDEEEEMTLRSFCDDVRPDSRLASTLVLDKTWMGSVVSIAPLHPWNSL